MKYLFTLCLLVFTLSASAQWQQTGSKVRYVNGLGIPTRDTAAGVAADSSQILIRPADSALYVKYKRTWLRVGGGGGSIAGSGTANYIPKFTSSTAIGNSQIFDNGTNVGIGTTSPATNLEISGSGAIARITGTAGSIPQLQLSSGGIVNWSLRSNVSSSAFAIFQDANERMRITSGGDVGIGTTSPATTLQVGNSSGLKQISIYGGGYDLALGASGGSIFGFASQAISTVFNTASVPLGVGTNAAQPLILGTSGAERMRITSGGNALIGTTTDNGTDRLQVSGSALVTAGLQAATTSGNVSLRTTASTYPFNISLGANAGIGMYQDGTTATLIGTNQTVSATAPLQILGTTLTLNASGNNNAQIFTNSNERFRVNGTGNVIVDPTQLGTKLLVNTTTDAGTDRVQVAGSISAEGFKQRYLARTTAYTATTSDYLIDCTTGTFTVTLYAASGNAGRILIIKNSGTGSITVDGNAAETIDGAATQTLGTQWSRISIISDGTNWKIISN